MQNQINVLWENICNSTPLTFWEFVQEFNSLKSLFPVVERALKDFDILSKSVSSYPCEVYTQGPTGIGKSVYNYLILLYRIYLHLQLKDPHLLFSFSEHAELSVVIIAPNRMNYEKGLLHFIESTGCNSLFNIYENEDEKVDSKLSVCVNVQKDGITFNMNGNELKLVIVQNESSLIGTQPVVSYINFEDEDPDAMYEKYNSLVRRVNSRFYGLNKWLYTTIIVDKYPNNLYSDLMDQKIKEAESNPHVIVERFTPIWMRDCKSYTDIAQIKNDYYMTLDDGTVYDVVDGYVPPIDDVIVFPRFWKNIDLYKMATENASVFIRDMVGIPLIKPLGVKVEVTNGLSALQACRKLIKDYNIQIVCSEGGIYLKIPDIRTSIKV